MSEKPSASDKRFELTAQIDTLKAEKKAIKDKWKGSINPSQYIPRLREIDALSDKLGILLNGITEV